MIRVNIEINCKFWFNKIKNPTKYINKRLKKISKNIPFLKKKNLIFTILLTNSSSMKKLNKQFRNNNKPTDVLAFPNFSTKNLKFAKKNNIYLGDIATCYEIINTRSNKNSFNLEFDKTWVHGFLHLIGFDHVKNRDHFKMQKTEKKILNSFT